MDLFDLFDRGSAWTREKIAGAQGSLDAPTCCEDWDVRAVVNHLLFVQGRFQARARGEQVGPPAGPPPDLVGDDPAAQFETARQATLAAYREPAASEFGGTLGIAFVDTIVHGTDIAKATGQDATIPSDLAEAAFGFINGRLSDDSRGSAFKPAVAFADDAPAQDKLLAYLGRHP
jgi:uncharacterized protein (TIGR03086 family)